MSNCAYKEDRCCDKTCSAYSITDYTQVSSYGLIGQPKTNVKTHIHYTRCNRGDFNIENLTKEPK